jgi:hypothetical protein
MDCWKNKVLPKLKAIFGKSAVKKAAADEIVKSFDESKVRTLRDHSLNLEFDV